MKLYPIIKYLDRRMESGLVDKRGIKSKSVVELNADNELLSVLMAAAKRPAMIRPENPVGMTSLMNCNEISSGLVSPRVPKDAPL